MTFTTAQDARAVLLPAFDATTLSDTTRRFLDQGGVSILIGESRAEYVGRGMTPERRAVETAETFRLVTGQAKSRSGLLLTAIDQELGGICRLHDVVPGFPASADIASASEDEIESLAHQIALIAAAMGVNCFLSPVLDVLTGRNSWLQGRTWSTDPALIGLLSSAYIRGAQRAGVAATGKHFPGFSDISGDPATEAHAVNSLPLSAIEAGLPPFRAAVAAGVEMMMVGPAIVSAIDDKVAALRSAKVVSMLKDKLGFKGVVMADDLDSHATMRGDSVPRVALDALNAGCDFLLLADVGNQLEDVANAISQAAETGAISRKALALSSARVRALAGKYACKG
ncbi:MAG: glycoside hydrolase family 3 N-terminal domain-containing protein [Paracoccaceae bacterium]